MRASDGLGSVLPLVTILYVPVWFVAYLHRLGFTGDLSLKVEVLMTVLIPKPIPAPMLIGFWSRSMGRVLGLDLARS
jgi:hypothetical protein